MKNTEKLIKVYDEGKNLLGSGHLLSLGSGVIRIKGRNLPIINSKTKVIIEVYNELSGIIPYLCEVSIASENQLNAKIIRQDAVVERRKSLKVKTDVSVYVDSLVRNDEDISKDVPNMKINILNLSIGGMLISCNYDLMINDKISFNFPYTNHQFVFLKAKIIRIDKIFDKITNQFSSLNYGCVFDKMDRNNEALITRFLFDRQIMLYKNR